MGQKQTDKHVDLKIKINEFDTYIITAEVCKIENDEVYSDQYLAMTHMLDIPEGTEYFWTNDIFDANVLRFNTKEAANMFCSEFFRSLYRFTALNNNIYKVTNPVIIGLNININSIDCHTSIVNDDIKYFNNKAVNYRNLRHSYSKYYEK